MSVVIAIAIWLGIVFVALALCRAAARADRALETMTVEERQREPDEASKAA